MLRPAATLDLICEHLGVETGLISQVPRENVSAFVARSATNRARRAALRVGQSAERVLPANAWRRVWPPLTRWIQRGQRSRPPLAQEDRDALIPYFADDIRLLERVTGQNFGDWLSTARDTREQVAARLDTVA